jgi:hypothetical protein
MSTSLIVIEGGELLAALGPDFAVAFDLAKAEKAPATRKAYGTDFRLFKVYCDAKGVSALPAAPETVASYIAAEAQTAKPSTIGRRIAAIRYAHKLAGLDTPTDAEGVKATMRGICRTFSGAKAKKAPAVAAKMLSMVATAPDRLSGLRDSALLLLGFAGHFVARSWLHWMWPTSRKRKPDCWSRSAAARPIRRPWVARSRSHAAMSLAPLRLSERG